MRSLRTWITRSLGGAEAEDDASRAAALNLAVAALLVEVLRADYDVSGDERRQVLDSIGRVLGLDAAQCEALLAEARARRDAGLGRLGSDAQESADLPERATPRTAEVEPRRKLRPRSREGQIRGYDHDPAAVRIALNNLERAGLAGLVHFERRDIEQAAPGREQIGGGLGR